jgi:hypothetical protein
MPRETHQAAVNIKNIQPQHNVHVMGFARTKSVFLAQALARYTHPTTCTKQA